MRRSGFATAVACIDGRIQTPVAEWMKNYLAVEWVDMITEPGADRVMAMGPLGALDAIKNKVRLSIKVHQSQGVGIAAHHDCLANPVSPKEHLSYVEQAVARMASWGLHVRVVGLWVNERWEVEVVRDTAW